MRFWCPFVLWMLIEIAGARFSVAEERFELWLHNGDRVAGQSISPLYDQLTEPLKLDNKAVGKKDNPPLALHCPLVPSLEAAGAWVEFTNGDVIPGKITEWISAQNLPTLSAQAEHLLVTLEAGGDFVQSTMAVRPDCVRRIWYGNREPKRLAPGTVNTVDGREIVARALRFGAGGLECLTEKGIQVLGYDQLREASFAETPNGLNAESDKLWSTAEAALPSIVRFKTARGSCVTCGNQVIQRIPDKEKSPAVLQLLPNWAVQSISLLPDRIRWASWRRQSELPLTVLPYTYAKTTKGAQRWSPQRNRNVQGTELRCAGISAEQGWGVHSGTTISVELPPESERFRAWVGLDQCSGRGGCARAKVVRDHPGGDVLWESDFLLGGQAPRQVDLEVRGVKTLLLVVDEAHDNRPSGADPWDIRDHVDWLWPMLTVKTTAEKPTLASVAPLSRWIPALQGFELSKEDTAHAFLRPMLSARGIRFAIVPTNTEQRDQGIVLTRTIRVTNNNARVSVSAGMDGVSGRHQHIVVSVNDTDLFSTPSPTLPVSYHPANKASYGEREYTLGPYLGQEVKFSLRLQPDQYKAGSQGGIVFDHVGFGPLIAKLPADGKFISAEVPLTSIKPAKLPGDWTWENGKSVKNSELKLKGLPFENGTALPAQSEITIPLDPSYKRFVAVVGKLDPTMGVSLISIALDGEKLWDTDGKFDGYATAAQLDIELPPEHKTMTIKVNNKEGYVVFGNAGFMTK